MRYVSPTVILLFSCTFAIAQDKNPPKWIWLDQTKENQTVYFRKVFEITGNISAARLSGTCDNEMTVFLDGKEVLKSTEWETPVSKDVADVLKASKGKHVLAVQAFNRDGPAGLVLRLDVDGRGGRSTQIFTDDSWLVSEKADKNWKALDLDDKSWKPASVIAKLGEGPWIGVNEFTLGKGAKLKTPTATPVDKIKVLKDFRVELLYSVPKATQGSWVNLCVDPKGRLIASDQYGGLYRITPSPLGGTAQGEGETKVEKLPIPLGGAHGLLYAFDSLYVMVNEGVKHTLPDGKQVTPKHGLWRVRSSDAGETFSPPELLRELQAGGEHGAHAILLAPDGKSLYVIIGDAAKLTTLSSSRVPLIWGEDHLLPRMPDGNGFMKGVLAPGGYIAKVDPDGKNWELISTGYRNEFDAAFNRQGELFTYDADMEWDFNTPWYRPTRVCLVTSGSEFGWRNGAGKWPPFYPDSLPAIFNVGPGSPTGMTFGYGAKFPAKYQEALFMCDWSYGKLYALHLTPDQSAYKAEIEEFLNGTPLPLTDVVVNPNDGAIYFAIGGRNTQSGLYRVTYTGKESTAEAASDDRGADLRALRHKIESFHGHKDPKSAQEVWPYLNHADRFIRFAARVALEWQDPKEWQDRALEEKDPEAAITALLALVRVSATDPFHRTKDTPPVNEQLKQSILQALRKIKWDTFNDDQRLELVRVYHVLFNRMGPPGDFERPEVIHRFDSVYPTHNHLLNGEICALLAYLEAPNVVSKTLKLMREAPTQEEQIEYARSLRVLKKGWTMDQRKEYFSWFLKAANFRGGASFGNFLKIIKTDAIATLTEQEKAALKPILEARPDPKLPFSAKPRPFVKTWTLEELVPLVEKGLTKRDYDRGRALFGEASCFACHRFNNEGGAAGHDLTGLGGRFSTRDLLEKITNPSKSISDQYAAVKIETTDGKTVVGRIVNLHNDNLTIQTDMRDPNSLVNVDRKKIESMEQSKVSMMPTGLLDVLKEDEVLDLIAYLLSRGDRKNAMFQK
ncbi:MAG TPA: c-type cytochrome [Gemmataceae bacterium]|jgi:putative heme-binding domain-containing protein|nr:c-type cytochrome [Gemmataceae bacterium]